MARMAKGEMLSTEQKTHPKQGSLRAPVVTILGHVDHGKTTLLDYIRKSQTATKEAGGITQHIGAYRIEHKGQPITFIDTPGHEAFSAMRSRGGRVADLAVLVVAADDGVMPQTRESIAHIKAANIPLIVAINKIDIAGTNLEKVKKQLSEEGILLEGYGGDVVAVPISAKTGQGVEDLLEMIKLVSEMQELADTSSEPLNGVIIEAKLDKFKGALATVLVKKGILRVGDEIFTISSKGKVKALIDSQGRRLKEATPSTPVEVLGFSSVPKVGEVVSSMHITKEEERPAAKPGISDKLEKLEENEIRLIIKADVAGSLEAIEDALESLKKEGQKVKIYYSDTGDITESEVLLAAATKSLIIGFNVGVKKTAEKLASEEKVLIRNYNVIYELLDELKEGLEALKERKNEEAIMGQAEILDTFKAADKKIAGCKVTSGRINQNDKIKIIREEKVVGTAEITSMKHKDSFINQASKGEEFGLLLSKDVPFAKGDIIISIGSR